MTVTLEDVVARLEQLGYEMNYGLDEPDIQFEIEKILDYAVVYCNLSSADQLPDILVKKTIDRVCAEFLFMKKNLGQLVDFDYEKAVKAIEQGDTKVTFTDDSTEESRFDSVVNYLQRGYDKWLAKFRVIKW